MFGGQRNWTQNPWIAAPGHAWGQGPALCLALLALDRSLLGGLLVLAAEAGTVTAEETRLLAGLASDLVKTNAVHDLRGALELGNGGGAFASIRLRWSGVVSDGARLEKGHDA